MAVVPVLAVTRQGEESFVYVVQQQGPMTIAPVHEDAMRTLLSGLAPGLPDELVTRIVQRAEGVPLYAVETVRMLLDQGGAQTELRSRRPDDRHVDRPRIEVDPLIGIAQRPIEGAIHKLEALVAVVR